MNAKTRADCRLWNYKVLFKVTARHVR